MFVLSRSRKGAWIEIYVEVVEHTTGGGRSRKGAWIEIFDPNASQLGGGSRSRKGAWIEIKEAKIVLKNYFASLPQGSVD